MSTANGASHNRGTPEIDPSGLSGMGSVFATAFARYTVELITMSKQAGLDPADLESYSSAVLRQELHAFVMPAWVRKEHQRLKAEGADSIDDQTARHLVARNKLVLAIREKGLSQREVARNIGMSAASLSRILKNPERSRLKTIRKIADSLGVDISDVL